MAARRALIRQADAKRLLTAAREAGWTGARLILENGRVELVADNSKPASSGNSFDSIMGAR